MDWISLILFIATLTLIIAIVFLDLAKNKYRYFFAIVVLGVAIYAYGLSYNQETLNTVDLILKAFGNTSQILRGVFRTSEISARINQDLLFLISAYAIHILGFGYTYLFIFTVFFNNLGLKMRFYLQQGKPHFLVLGEDDKLNYLLQTFERDFLNQTTHQKSKIRRVNLAIPKTVLATKEIKTRYAFKPGITSFDIDNQSITPLLGHQRHEKILVSLIKDNRQILRLVEQLNTYFKRYPKANLAAYILYDDAQYLPVYESFSAEKQRVQFISYHQLIAQQLVLEYPLTTLIPSSTIDFEKATLKNVRIKYHLFGFGPTNQEIYRHLFVTNQLPPATSSFLGKEFTNYHQQPIRYTIYSDQDIKVPQFGDFIVSAPKKDSLPLPQLSATTHWRKTSFLQTSYIEALDEEVNKNDDHQIMIIAFGDDVMNLRVLQEVLAWTRQRRLQNYHLFVQILDRRYVTTSQLFKDQQVIPFGFGDYGFSMNQMINPVFNKIASQIHKTLHPEKSFWQLPNQGKETLLYEAIGLRFKLNLMGVDLAVTKKGITEAKFMQRYDPSEDARFHQAHPRAKNDADLNRYKAIAKKKRNLLARQEHLRWAAYRIIQGYVPMSFSEMLEKQSHVDHVLKKDARLTTFEGLFELHEFLVTKLGYTFANADLIYPFFHTMDHLYQVIQNTPYQVVDVIDPKNNQTIELEIESPPLVESEIKEN